MCIIFFYFSSHIIEMKLVSLEYVTMYLLNQNVKDIALSITSFDFLKYWKVLMDSVDVNLDKNQEKSINVKKFTEKKAY